MKTSGRLREVFVEDFRKELGEIESPVARHLFILAKANHLIHLRVAEYVVLIELADVTGHYAVGVLLESCLADKLAYAERTRRLIRHIVKTEVVDHESAAEHRITHAVASRALVLREIRAEQIEDSETSMIRAILESATHVAELLNALVSELRTDPWIKSVELTETSSEAE